MYLLFLVLPVSLKFAPNSSPHTYLLRLLPLGLCCKICWTAGSTWLRMGKEPHCWIKLSAEQRRVVSFSMQHSAFCLSSLLSDLFAVLSFLSWCSLFILFFFAILPVLIKGYQNAHPSHLIIHGNSSHVNPAQLSYRRACSSLYKRGLAIDYYFLFIKKMLKPK